VVETTADDVPGITGNPISDTRRSASGVFEVDNAVSGPTAILIQARGLAPAAIDLDLNAAETYAPIEIVLQKAASVIGLIYRAGAPVTVRMNASRTSHPNNDPVACAHVPAAEGVERLRDVG